MKNLLLSISIGCACSLFGVVTLADEAAAPAAPVDYKVKVHEFEGCECESVCPCVFSKDTSYGDCRAIAAFTFNGTYGATELDNLTSVVVITKSGVNMESNMGNWTGVVYLPDSGTPEQKQAMMALLNSMSGSAFASLEERTAPINVTREGDVHELTVGEVAKLRIHAIKGPNGGMTMLHNAPSPLAYPMMVCAIADVNTYDDGNAAWSFTGRNGFYADLMLASGE